MKQYAVYGGKNSYTSTQPGRLKSIKVRYPFGLGWTWNKEQENFDWVRRETAEYYERATLLHIEA